MGVAFGCMLILGFGALVFTIFLLYTTRWFQKDTTILANSPKWKRFWTVVLWIFSICGILFVIGCMGMAVAIWNDMMTMF